MASMWTHGTQGIRRVALLLRALAAHGRAGGRLLDLTTGTGLERPTVHRILKALAAEGLVAQDPASRRYRLGPLLYELGLAAAPSVDLRALSAPSLGRIAARTGDTVFLFVRSGNDSVCLDRQEGSFPIKTLTVEVGTRRPLGMGAGGLTLLMPLPDDQVRAVLAANSAELGQHPDLDPAVLLATIQRGREAGYLFNERPRTPGGIYTGVPVANRHGGPPLAAITVGAIAERMGPERRAEVAAVLKAEVAELERRLAEVG